MARARHGSYLFQRPGSSHWHVRLRSPGKRTEISLRTSDRRQAEILAWPLIQQHKESLIAARPRVEAAWVPKYQPGQLHVGPDGSRFFAPDTELHVLDADGTVIRREPNGGPGHRIVNLPNFSRVDLGTRPFGELRRLMDTIEIGDTAPRGRPPMKIRLRPVATEGPDKGRRRCDSRNLPQPSQHRRLRPARS